MPTANQSIPVILDRLRRKHPNARYELDWQTPLELLVATILAAQCTDERVNRVTATLFKTYRTARDYADGDTATLEEAIRPTGFYRNKAKAIQGACRALVDRFGGEVPRTMAELITLPGVARKTANVVLNTAFDLPSGVIVDTHVARVSRRMGLSREDDPDRIEQDLMRLLPEREWTFFGPAMVLHGRYTCTAKGPQCGGCIFADGLCAKKLEPGVTPSASPDAAPDEAPIETTKKTASSPAKTKAGKTTETERETKTTMATKKTTEKTTTPAKSSGSSSGGLPPIPESWREALADEVKKPYFAELERFIAEERASADIFPPQDEIFNALELTPFADVKVVLLGQDPYHDDGQAHGLCFSVRPPVPPPPSLVNMFKELQSDVGFRTPNHGSLVRWAEQGVLLLNAVLTVRAHTPNSHKNRGWETFTDAVLRKVSERSDPVVFVLWGAYAQKKAKLIDTSRHTVLSSAHPSPLSARNGFFGSKPFSSINEALSRKGKAPIDWQLPNV
ncbi:Uracil-DNA glycosylase, family 1 [Minicystis rosea]|nr:Uracil-DNA glycosylase, family 1 [Minicystis rosea]